MSELYCAKIENGIVTNVIVCGCSDWAKQHLGDEWICTNEKLVGIGWIVENGEIRPPQPYPSWVWSNQQWEPPVPKPEGDYIWSEDDMAWIIPQM